MAYLHTSVRFKCCSYLCMPVCSCVCVYISIPARFCKIFCSFCLILFAPAFRVCRALWLLLHPLVSAIPLLLNDLTLFALRVSLFRYFVLFVLFYHTVQAPQQTSPENWPIRARHLRRARPRLRLWRRVREEESGGGGIL